jgi:cell shape-determining protein MreD
MSEKIKLNFLTSLIAKLPWYLKYKRGLGIILGAIGGLLLNLGYPVGTQIIELSVLIFGVGVADKLQRNGK